jgi:nicotinate-nucleotide adenylyltransferase
LVFDRWKNYRDIIANYRIVVYPRKNSPIDKTTLPANVTLADTPLYNVSSTPKMPTCIWEMLTSN